MSSPRCAFPDCRRLIVETSRTLVCRAHRHSPWCACRRCALRRRGKTALAQTDAGWAAVERLPIGDVPLNRIEAEPCRALWLRCLSQHWDAALGEPDYGVSVGEARRWIGTADFFTVCALCDLDGQAVLERYQALMGGQGAVA